MKVSVIIPVYNQAMYLDECLCSVVAQNYPGVEIIVVDDGSTDDSWQVASKYPVQVIRQANQGQRCKSSGPALNAGLRAAAGEFILPLNGDDWIDSEYLAKTVPVMKGCTGIVSTDMHRFGAIDDVIRAERCTLEQELVSNTLPITSLVRRDAVLQVGGYWHYGFEDWDLWLSLLEKKWEVDVVNEVLFHYRVNSGGLNEIQSAMRDDIYWRLAYCHPGFGVVRG